MFLEDWWDWLTLVAGIMEWAASRLAKDVKYAMYPIDESMSDVVSNARAWERVAEALLQIARTPVMGHLLGPGKKMTTENELMRVSIIMQDIIYPASEYYNNDDWLQKIETVLEDL